MRDLNCVRARVPLWTLILAVVAGHTLVAPRDAGAQTPEGWQAYYGCWQPVAVSSSSSLPGEPGRVVCIRPEPGGASIQFITAVNDSVVDRMVINTTGSRSPVNRGGCTGWESAQKGSAGRVYTKSEYTCEGGVSRTASGLIGMLSSTEWMDVQTVSVGGQSSTQLQRYREIAPPSTLLQEMDSALGNRSLAVMSARVAASGAVSLEDIIDASANVVPATVEGWLLERRQGFVLEAKHIVKLANAGVPDDIIDLVVALSYPTQFSSELSKRRLAMYPVNVTPVNSARVASPDYVVPPELTANPQRDCRYNWDYRYCGNADRDRDYHHHHWNYYSPFGFYPYGYYDYIYYGYPYYRPRPTVIIIDNDDDNRPPPTTNPPPGGPPQQQPPRVPQGRAVNGRGYTNGNQSGSGSSTGSADQSQQNGPTTTQLGTIKVPVRTAVPVDRGDGGSTGSNASGSNNAASSTGTGAPVPGSRGIAPRTGGTNNNSSNGSGGSGSSGNTGTSSGSNNARSGGAATSGNSNNSNAGRSAQGAPPPARVAVPRNSSGGSGSSGNAGSGNSGSAGSAAKSSGSSGTATKPPAQSSSGSAAKPRGSGGSGGVR